MAQQQAIVNVGMLFSRGMTTLEESCTYKPQPQGTAEHLYLLTG